MQLLTEEKRTLEVLVGELRERETRLLRENEVLKALLSIS
jgi:hypothetical protein